MADDYKFMSNKNQMFLSSIRVLGGNVTYPVQTKTMLESQSEMLLEFVKYIRDTGARFFNGYEIALANNITVARELGYDKYLVPPQEAWPRAAALALLADMCRDAAGGPVKCRNWWRPADYNERVGGAPGSDHIDACAFDLDYKSRSARARAMRQVLDPLYKTGLFNLSLGVGARTTHIGMYSDRGHRRWKYA